MNLVSFNECCGKRPIRAARALTSLVKVSWLLKWLLNRPNAVPVAASMNLEASKYSIARALPMVGPRKGWPPAAATSPMEFSKELARAFGPAKRMSI